MFIVVFKAVIIQNKKWKNETTEIYKNILDEKWKWNWNNKNIYYLIIKYKKEAIKKYKI